MWEVAHKVFPKPVDLFCFFAFLVHQVFPLVAPVHDTPDVVSNLETGTLGRELLGKNARLVPNRAATKEKSGVKIRNEGARVVCVCVCARTRK